MTILLFGRVRADLDLPYIDQLLPHINIVPFETIIRYVRALLYSHSPSLMRHAVINLLGNIIMFIPLGAFIPFSRKAFRRFFSTMLVTLLTLLIIETIQLFALVGSFDIDDLILNLIGSAIGYFIFYYINKFTEGKRKI